MIGDAPAADVVSERARALGGHRRHPKWKAAISDIQHGHRRKRVEIQVALGHDERQMRPVYADCNKPRGAELSTFQARNRGIADDHVGHQRLLRRIK